MKIYLKSLGFIMCKIIYMCCKENIAYCFTSTLIENPKRICIHLLSFFVPQDLPFQ